MSLAKIGLMGLAVMGENLAQNIGRNGFPVAVWNRDGKKVDSFLERTQGKNFSGSGSIEEFVKLLEKPRKIIMMVKAGDPVDWTIDLLSPHLDKGDIIIDGGNSHFEDTQRRERELKALGFRFIGSGVSGGESGALWGPSIMPGGQREAYEELRPVLEAIAAQVEDGPCVAYIGPDGAGHFVKMVHNGIEYGDMQLIAEAYDMLRRVFRMEAGELADIFGEWNQGVLNSFLIEITSDIFTVRDEKTGRALVDLILDRAGQKGTGLWTSHLALDLAVAIPTIHAAIEARILSGLKDERVKASRRISGPELPSGLDKNEWIRNVHDALYASKICSYAQGMALISAGSARYNWNINLSELSRIWKGGCIIRARFLNRIQDAYRKQPDLPNLLMDDEFRAWITGAQPRWRRTVAMALEAGVAAPAMAASLTYFDSYRTADLPQNLTQAQRDYFGSHLYQRTDDPDGEFIHTDWLKE